MMVDGEPNVCALNQGQLKTAGNRAEYQLGDCTEAVAM